jgi:hypothetical protein
MPLQFTETSSCRRCLLRLAGKSICVAFPRGIPAEIMAGHVDHTEPYRGDGGFRFVAERLLRQEAPLPWRREEVRSNE